MNNDHHSLPPDPGDSRWEPFFEQKPLATDAFARRTLVAIRDDRRRRRALTRSGWGAAAAAVMISFVLWLGILPNDPANGAYASEVTPEEAAVYGELLALEAILADAEALLDEDNREVLDLLLALHE